MSLLDSILQNSPALLERPTVLGTENLQFPKERFMTFGPLELRKVSGPQHSPYLHRTWGDWLRSEECVEWVQVANTNPQWFLRDELKPVQAESVDNGAHWWISEGFPIVVVASFLLPVLGHPRPELPGVSKRIDFADAEVDRKLAECRAHGVSVERIVNGATVHPGAGGMRTKWEYLYRVTQKRGWMTREELLAYSCRPQLWKRLFGGVR